MSNFRIIIIGIFAGAALIAVLIFAGILPGFKGNGGPMGGSKITLWATFDHNKMGKLISDTNNANKNLFSIKYTQKKQDSYENNLIDALASGTGPDIWIISQDTALRSKNKVFAIPFKSFSERNFNDSFIDSSGVFLDKNNQVIIGMPIAVDPIVLYWNKDLFSSAGIAGPPKYWNEFLVYAEKLTKQDTAGNIIQSGAALGEFRNIKNAKGILSMLILQGGSKIVNPVSLKIDSIEKKRNILSPFENAVIFFNEFSNSAKSSYSWNRALPSSDDMFTNGSLAMYFGYASEFESIKKRNPHLNFDVAVVPQIKDDSFKSTFGKVYSVVISKFSPHMQAAFSAVFKLTGKNFSKQFAEKFYMAPARRGLLEKGSDNPIFSIFYKSAVMAKTWLEPDSQKVYEIFQNMVESTATGKAKVSDSTKGAEKQIGQLLKQFYVK